MEKLTSAAPSVVRLFHWLFMAVFIMLICRPFIIRDPNQPIVVVKPPEMNQCVIPDPLQNAGPIVLPKNKTSPVLNKKDDLFFGSIIQQAADLHEVDSALVRAIIMAESGYNPKAISKKGAKGLMQLMPKTAESLGVVDSFNPEENIYAGVEYFKKLMTRFDGNVEFALAAYNAGSRKVRKYQGVPPFKATKYYIKKVLQYYQTYKEQMTAETGRT